MHHCFGDEHYVQTMLALRRREARARRTCNVISRLAPRHRSSLAPRPFRARLTATTTRHLPISSYSAPFPFLFPGSASRPIIDRTRAGMRREDDEGVVVVAPRGDSGANEPDDDGR